MGSVAVADAQPASLRETPRLLDEYDKLISIRDHTVASKASAITVKQINQSANLADARVSTTPLPKTNLSSFEAPNGVAKSSPVFQKPSVLSSTLSVPKTRPNPLPPKSPSTQHKPTPPTPGSSGIDPIFLTKSNVLVKAEIQQKRQRLEKVLEEQVHKSQRQKAHDHDVFPDFDVTDVFRRAQELIKPTKLLEKDRTNGVAPSSDSFDENTLYSSQMDESTTTEDAAESNKRRPHRICRFFLRGEDCRYGDSCTFSHDPVLKQKLAADGSQVVDLGRVTADEQTSSRQDGYPNKRPRKNDTQIIAQTKEKLPEMPIPQSQGEREMAERIARLEAELISARAGKEDVSTRAPHQRTKATHDPPEESAYSPPGADEFGRDAGLREPGLRQVAAVSQRGSPPDRQLRAREYDGRNGNPPSPLPSNVRIITNNIRSPAAPQPSRVSPLAVAKVPQVSQLQHGYGEHNNLSRAENPSVEQSPNNSTHPRNARKRRRGRHSGEQIRNVAPRTDPESPVIRVKEEPASPPPFIVTNPELRNVRPRQEPTRQLYVDTAPRYREEEPSFYQPRQVERLPYGDMHDIRGPQTPLIRRVVSRNGQQYSTNEESDLRRVVTDPRHVRAPMSPAPYPVQFSAPQPRATRAMSQVYVTPTSQGMHNQPHQYHEIIQSQPSTYIPQERSPSPKLSQWQESPLESRPIAMAPPPKRIIVDQWGNRFMEAPVAVERHASVAPVARGSDVEPRYEQPLPRSASVIRQPRLLRVEDDVQYVRRAPSPAPTSFYEDYSDGRTMPRYEEFPAQDARIIRMPSIRPTERSYGAAPDSDGRMIRMQSVRPTERQYETPREQIIRMQSVRPEQPRIINLSERDEPARQVSRQMSVVPDNGGFRQVSYVEGERPRPQYVPQVQNRSYMEEVQDDGGFYEAPNSGGRRVMQRM